MAISSVRFYLATVLAAISSAAVGAQYYATTGNYAEFEYDPQFNSISYKSYLGEMSRYGFSLDRLVLTDSGDATQPGYLHGYQITARILNNVLNDSVAYTGQGRILLDLTNLFFEYNQYPGGVPCLGYGSQPTIYARWDLRPDYQARMADFMTYIFGTVDASDFEVISVHNESGCIPPADINAAAAAVKSAIPLDSNMNEVEVAAGYPISIDVSPASYPGHGLNHNGRFPTGLDRVISWAYGVYDPANDTHPLNINGNFSSYFSQFKAKLRWWQRIDWVTDGHFLNCRHGSVCYSGGSGMGWTQGIHHAESIANWCSWLPTEPKINGQIAFTYGNIASPSFFSIAEMPQVVRDTHANVSNGVCDVPHTILKADAFTGVTSGAALNGRAVEVGAGNWVANGNAKFGGGGVLGAGFMTGNTGTHPIGNVSFNPASHPNKDVILTADIDPTGAGWVALGFAEHATWGWWVDGQIWVYINNSSQYNVLAGGTTYSLTGGVQYDTKVRPNQFNRVELFYDPQAGTVSVWINGWQMLSPTSLPGGFTPAINYAGWSALSATQGSTRVDSFELKLDP